MTKASTSVKHKSWISTSKCRCVVWIPCRYVPFLITSSLNVSFQNTYTLLPVWSWLWINLNLVTEFTDCESTLTSCWKFQTSDGNLWQSEHSLGVKIGHDTVFHAMTPTAGQYWTHPIFMPLFHFSASRTFPKELNIYAQRTSLTHNFPSSLPSHIPSSHHTGRSISDMRMGFAPMWGCFVKSGATPPCQDTYSPGAPLVLIPSQTFLRP